MTLVPTNFIQRASSTKLVVVVRSFSMGHPMLAKKPKADVVLVGCKSVVSGHFRPMRRARLGDKVEFLAFDPWVQQEVIYREEEKIKSIREDGDQWFTKPSELKIPDFGQVLDKSENKAD